MKNVQNEITNAQFHQIMTEIQFRKNQNFRANKNNLYRTIQYVHNMEINQKAFEIIEYLIKQFGVSILLCFEPFYQKIIKNNKARLEFKQKLQRISSLVICQVKPFKCGELKFFNIQGKSKKAFNVKQKTPEELQLLNELQFCRNCIIVKKQNPDLQKIPKDQQNHLKLIIKQIQSKSLNPFAQYYLQKMLKKVLNQYKLEKIQGSTADQTQQQRLQRQKIQKGKVDQDDNFEIQSTLRAKSQEKQNHASSLSSQKTINQKIETPLQKQQLNQKNLKGKKSQYGPNFANVPLCCRTFFFDQQKILQSEDKRTQYKSYRFPFNPVSIQTFKKTICGFLNTIGGQIYIGIKETTIQKYRYVLGNYLTENDKQEVLKSFRKITQSIFPNVTQDLQVEFVPVRKSPFPDINLLGQVQTYFYDFTKKPFDLDKCPYRPARYVIRVRVPAGNKQSMYSYVETECQLNKSTTSSEFIAFRSQNEVLVKEISQEVLRKYKQKLLYGQQKSTFIHNGPCMRPQIGDPKNQPQPEEEVMDSKQIEAVLYTGYMTKQAESNSMSSLNPQMTVRKTMQKNFQKMIKQQNTTQDDMKEIYRHPLTFIVQHLPFQRLKKCIAKTPAIDYTVIKQEQNVLTHQELILISVDAYSNMQQFLRVKSQIQKHFTKENVEFIGASTIIKLENSDNKRVVEDLLTKNKHKYVINKKNLQFYSLQIAASYLIFMKNMGFKVEAIPD